MKAYILKNRPFKYLLLLVVESTKKGQSFELIYRGFHTKNEAINYYEQHGDYMLCVYACIYKKTSTFANICSGFLDFFKGSANE